MRREQLQVFKNWFAEYVKDIAAQSEGSSELGIEIKEEHTRRVCENIINIAKSLQLQEEDILLAETIALFHDIGRFKQILVYGTFNDRISENHALLGVKELKRSGVLSELIEPEVELVLTSVAHHNRLNLPEDLPDRHILFVKLIRDADKLDILEVFCKYQTRENTALSSVLYSGLPDTPGYSRGLVGDILQQRGCRYTDVRNINDRKLLQLSWVFDIYFNYTLAEVSRRGYVDKIINTLPRTPDTQKIHQFLLSYMARPESKQ